MRGTHRSANCPPGQWQELHSRPRAPPLVPLVPFSPVQLAPSLQSGHRTKARAKREQEVKGGLAKRMKMEKGFLKRNGLFASNSTYRMRSSSPAQQAGRLQARLDSTRCCLCPGMSRVVCWPLYCAVAYWRRLRETSNLRTVLQC